MTTRAPLREPGVTARNPATDPRGPAHAAASPRAVPVLAACALLLGLAVFAACGSSAGSPRAAQSGNVFVPGTPTPVPTLPLGSVPGGEIQGVLARYQVGVGSDVTLAVQVSSPQSKTATKVLVRSVGGTFASQEFPTSFNTAVATVSLKGVGEGVHQGEVSALYADGAQASSVLFQLQVGASTAPAVGGVSQATGAQQTQQQGANPGVSQAGSQNTAPAR